MSGPSALAAGTARPVLAFSRDFLELGGRGAGGQGRQVAGSAVLSVVDRVVRAPEDVGCALLLRVLVEGDARVMLEVMVGRVLVAVEPGVGLSAAEVVASWEADDEARAVSSAVVEAAPGGEFMPGLVELILIPGGVNLVTSALYDVVGRVIRRSRPDRGELSELELVEITTALGDRVVVARLRQERL